MMDREIWRVNSMDWDREFIYAYYIHCFAHELQLVVVAVVQKHFAVENFFDKLVLLLNVVGLLVWGRIWFEKIFRKNIDQRTKKGEIKTWKRLNQEV